MQQVPIDYFSRPEPVRQLTLREKVGRSVAMTSFALPFLAFALLVGMLATIGDVPFPVTRFICMSSLAASCLLGLIGLGGSSGGAKKALGAGCPRDCF
jgi:hypothetical protein